jgi:putative cardiolipin synthase
MKFFTLFLFLITTSCSTLKVEYRNPANAPESDCRKLMQEILKVNDEGEVPLKDIQAFRNILDEHYENIADSVKDLELTPDLPLNTEAKLILDPQEGLLAKVMMIRKAKKTIDLTYFIFKDDDTSKMILHELRMAIKRGVKVRLMTDSMGSLSKAPFYNDIKALSSLSGKPILDSLGNPTGEYASMEAVLFNPIFNVSIHVQNWYRKIYNLFVKEENKKPIAEFRFNRRSHDKILLVDSFSPNDSMVMIGGRNIADHYYAINEGENHLIMDAEILLKGVSRINEKNKLENIIEEHYNRIFFYLANRNFKDFLIKTNAKIARREFKQMRSSTEKIIGENGLLKDKFKTMIDSNYLENDFENSLVSVVNQIENLSRDNVYLHPSKQRVISNVNSLVDKLNEHMKSANSSVDIITPYFWMPDEEIEALISWLEKDPNRQIRVVTNSLATNNHLASQAIIDYTFEEKIFKRIKDTPLEKQFKLYSYGKLDHENLSGKEKYGLLHAKVFVVDGKKIMISTSNLDPISRHINSEFGISAQMLEDQSKTKKDINSYIDFLVSRSTEWNSPDSIELRTHPKMKIKLLLEKLAMKIIYAFNLEPIL